MFDLFRDIILEAQGIDSEKAEIERAKRKKEKDKNKIIFSIGVKRVVVGFSIFFLIMSIMQLPVFLLAGNILYFIRGFLQVGLVIGTLICLKVHKKKSEIIAIIFIVIFFILQYSTLYFMAL